MEMTTDQAIKENNGWQFIASNAVFGLALLHVAGPGTPGRDEPDIPSSRHLASNFRPGCCPSRYDRLGRL